MHKHDPARQISFIQQALSQNRKPIGFFLGAGCPLSIRVNQREEDGSNVTDPLIWDVAGLTKVISKALSSGDPEDPKSWDKIVQIVKEDGGDSGNIELLLSRIRVFASVAGSGNVRGLTRAELTALDADSRKGAFERKAASAYVKALEAITYNVNGHEWSRRQKWREIFGALFPA